MTKPLLPLPYFSILSVRGQRSAVRGLSRGAERRGKRHPEKQRDEGSAVYDLYDINLKTKII